MPHFEIRFLHGFCRDPVTHKRKVYEEVLWALCEDIHTPAHSSSPAIFIVISTFVCSGTLQVIACTHARGAVGARASTYANNHHHPPRLHNDLLLPPLLARAQEVYDKFAWVLCENIVRVREGRELLYPLENTE